MQECRKQWTFNNPSFDVFSTKKTFLTKDFSSNIYPVTSIWNLLLLVAVGTIKKFSCLKLVI